MPGPISAQAEQYLNAEAAKVPAGRTGQVSATITNQGFVTGVGVRWKTATASTFIAKDASSGLTYGVRGGFAF